MIKGEELVHLRSVLVVAAHANGSGVCRSRCVEADKADSSSERSELQQNFLANPLLTFCTSGMLIFLTTLLLQRSFAWMGFFFFFF